MKSQALTTTLLTSVLLLTAQAQLLVPYLTNPEASPAPPSAAIPPVANNAPYAAETHQRGQNPMAASSQPSDADSPNTSVTISDVLGAQDEVSIFAGFTRDIDAVAARLEDGGSRTTVLAPRNKALMALPRKPWEDPADYAAGGVRAYVGEDGQSRALANLRRFTEAHVVPVSPWKEGEKAQRMEGTGGEVWWEKGQDGVVRIMPGKVEVEGVASRVGNGEVWVLKEVLNFEV